MNEFQALLETISAAAKANAGESPEVKARAAGNDLLCFVLGNASYHAGHNNPLAQRICVLVGSMKPHLVHWGAN